MFRRKSDEILKAKLNEGRSEEDKIDNIDEIDMDKLKENEKFNLEKGDLLALILAGYLRFAPVFIVLILIMIWAYKGM